ncbi:MAG: lipoate--protein ligase [Bacteroidales bacterium]|nr:lipoate--protein ligase [Bacteroidales bacterium]
MPKLQIIVSNQTNPFQNVAVENYLMTLPEADTVTMYLWKNRRTVVIGQNQNPFSECDVERLEADGGFLMRRRTGGGAVYHDDGNLNFSFVIPHEIYDVDRQFQVISGALASYGLEVEKSGRNDLLCCGRKFSGNAFSVGKYRRLHHGTLLIAGNMEDLKRYLKVKPAKLQKHGVSSVQSRVVNLAELNSAITADGITPHLVSAFESVYGGRAEVCDFADLVSNADVQRIYAEMASDEWRFGRWRQFTADRTAQFDWGGVELSLQVDARSNVITSVEIASDALDLEALERVRQLLTGASLDVRPDIDGTIGNDILNLIY